MPGDWPTRSPRLPVACRPCGAGQSGPASRGAESAQANATGSRAGPRHRTITKSPRIQRADLAQMIDHRGAVVVERLDQSVRFQGVRPSVDVQSNASATSSGTCSAWRQPCGLRCRLLAARSDRVSSTPRQTLRWFRRSRDLSPARLPSDRPRSRLLQRSRPRRRRPRRRCRLPGPTAPWRGFRLRSSVRARRPRGLRRSCPRR